MEDDNTNEMNNNNNEQINVNTSQHSEMIEHDDIEHNLNIKSTQDNIDSNHNIIDEDNVNIKTSTNGFNGSNIDTFSKPLELIQNLSDKYNYNVNLNSGLSTESFDNKIRALETKIHRSKSPITKLTYNYIANNATQYNNNNNNNNKSNIAFNELIGMIGPIKPFNSVNPKITQIPQMKKYVPLITSNLFKQKKNNKSFISTNTTHDNDNIFSSTAPSSAFLHSNTSSYMKINTQPNFIESYAKTWKDRSINNKIKNNNNNKELIPKNNNVVNSYKSEFSKIIEHYNQTKKNKTFNRDFYHSELTNFGEKLFGKKISKGNKSDNNPHSIKLRKQQRSFQMFNRLNLNI